MSTVEDLDVLVPEDKHVKFGGHVYQVPGDLPLETHLRIQAAQQKAAFGEGPNDQTEALTAIKDAVLDLLLINVPEDERAERAERLDRQLMKLGLSTLSRITMYIYRAAGDDDEDLAVKAAEPDPPAPASTPAPETPGTTASTT